MRMLTRVVFPAPLWPSRLYNENSNKSVKLYQRISPSLTEKFTSFRAIKLSNIFLSPTARIVCYNNDMTIITVGYLLVD